MKKEKLVFLLAIALILNSLGGCASPTPSESIPEKTPSLSAEEIPPLSSIEDGLWGTEVASSNGGQYKEKFIKSDCLFGLSFNLTVDEFTEKYNQAAEDTWKAIKMGAIEKTWEYDSKANGLPSLFMGTYEELPTGMVKYGGYINGPSIYVYSFNDYVVGVYTKIEADNMMWDTGWVGCIARIFMVLDDCTYNEAVDYLWEKINYTERSINGYYDQGQLDIAQAHVIIKVGRNETGYSDDYGSWYLGEFATENEIVGGIANICSLAENGKYVIDPKELEGAIRITTLWKGGTAQTVDYYVDGNTFQDLDATEDDGKDWDIDENGFLVSTEKQPDPDISDMEYDEYYGLYYDSIEEMYYDPYTNEYVNKTAAGMRRGKVVSVATHVITDLTMGMWIPDSSQMMILDRNAFGLYLVYVPINEMYLDSKIEYHYLIVIESSPDGEEYYYTPLEIVNDTDTNIPSIVTDYLNGEVVEIINNYLVECKWIS